jgi:hypothetical protein
MGSWSYSSRSWNHSDLPKAFRDALRQKNAMQADAGAGHSEGETEEDILNGASGTPRASGPYNYNNLFFDKL